MSDPASGDFDVRLSWPADGLSDRPAVVRDETASPTSSRESKALTGDDDIDDVDDIDDAAAGVVPLPLVARRLETVHRDLARLSARVDALARAVEKALAPRSDDSPPTDGPTPDELLQPVREEIALLRRRITLRVRPPTAVLGDDKLAAIADAVVQRLQLGRVGPEHPDAVGPEEPHPPGQ
ncbi:MAG: hypothetical protein ACRD29_02670 [Acidimicrobiales bacterium]